MNFAFKQEVTPSFMMLSDALYDDSAEKYEELLVKQRFQNPAIDLISAMNPMPDSSLLDIGTGTGAALFPAVDQIGSGGVVVGLDPSRDMLRIASQKGATLLVQGKIPGMPFLEESFDNISANFVLSHMEDYGIGLEEIYKILKTNGTFGATTWGEGQQDYNDIWNNVARQFINESVLAGLGQDQIPWESWFEQVCNIEQAFDEAGFTHIDITTKEYVVPMGLSDYLECRYTLLSGKFVQKTLSDTLMAEFRKKMHDAFESTCGNEITYVGRVNIAIARKPSN